MITMFAQIYVPICEWCAQFENGSWEWWLRGCWKYDCDPIGGLVAMGVAMAAAAGVQLWAASRQPKAGA